MSVSAMTPSTGSTQLQPQPVAHQVSFLDVQHRMWLTWKHWRHVCERPGFGLDKLHQSHTTSHTLDRQPTNRAARGGLPCSAGAEFLAFFDVLSTVRAWPHDAYMIR